MRTLCLRGNAGVWPREATTRGGSARAHGQKEGYAMQVSPQVRQVPTYAATPRRSPLSLPARLAILAIAAALLLTLAFSAGLL